MIKGMRDLEHRRKVKTGPNGLPMDVGDTFRPKGMAQDIEALEDFYGAKGYIDVTTSSRNLIVIRIPNTERGTMDLEFQIDEGQKSFIEAHRDSGQYQDQGQGDPPRVGGGPWRDL